MAIGQKLKKTFVNKYTGGLGVLVLTAIGSYALNSPVNITTSQDRISVYSVNRLGSENQMLWDPCSNSYRRISDLRSEGIERAAARVDSIASGYSDRNWSTDRATPSQQCGPDAYHPYSQPDGRMP